MIPPPQMTTCAWAGRATECASAADAPLLPDDRFCHPWPGLCLRTADSKRKNIPSVGSSEVCSHSATAEIPDIHTRRKKQPDFIPPYSVLRITEKGKGGDRDQLATLSASV